jgi:hypothetical protein
MMLQHRVTMLIRLMGLDLFQSTLAERQCLHGLTGKIQQLTIVSSYHFDGAAFIKKME